MPKPRSKSKGKSGRRSPRVKRVRVKRTRVYAVRPPVSVGDVVLSIDASSSCSGWAVFTVDRSENPTLVEFGKVKPSGGMLEARVREMREKLVAVADRYRPDLVIVERTSGLSYHKERNSSLPALSFAQGVIAGGVEQSGYSLSVEVCDETEWTNLVPKDTRKEEIAERYPAYGLTASLDDGGDISDAIGLGRWRIVNAVVSSGDDTVSIFTDGSSQHNPVHIGGWAAIVCRPGDLYESHGFEPGAGSNKMELRAVIEGLKSIGDSSKVIVYTDSAYVIRLASRLTRGGKQSGGEDSVSAEFRTLLSKHRVSFSKVRKGDFPEHDRAHHLSREAVFEGVKRN
jgi:ribonuclease HI